MKATLAAPRVFEFYFPDVDTLVQVSEADGAVEIRASRDTFSARRKACFIRVLATEGFIPDSYYWFTSGSPSSFLGVRWLIDFSWIELPQAALAETRRFMVRLLTGGLLLWFALMLSLFLR